MCAQSPTLHAAYNMQKFLGLFFLAEMTNAECTVIHNKKYSVLYQRYHTSNLEHCGQRNKAHVSEEAYNAETIWPAAMKTLEA